MNYDELKGMWMDDTPRGCHGTDAMDKISKG
jgi:hypothetical protein